MHEDQDCIILNKAPNVLVIPDRYNPEKPNLYHILESKYERIWVVHRLDKTTSGVILFAKNEAAHKIFQEQFENRTATKIYQCLVLGQPKDSGIIEYAIGKHPRKKRMIVSNKGKASKTEFAMLESFGMYSLLLVKILTGRTHQIRVHLEAIGHSIVGDPLYGGTEAFYLSSIKPKFRLGKGEEERPLLNRVALHAHQLEVKSPQGNNILVEANLPKDMHAVLKQLRRQKRP